ncbi:MAG: glycosyltransferase family 4 protein [Bacteroidota bacterium]|nr:glycosyltransferase family 4 protein [Bacteroidota bacterium]
MKKVLIITYYWPPSAGVGVQRWLKFSKYLSQFGWEPIIFTPENPDFNLKDPSLDKNISPELEIVKFPIWEPFKLFNRFTGGKNKENIKQGLVLEKMEVTFKDKLSIWVRGNLFIPDPRRFWVKPSVKFLKDFVRDRGIEYVITTGPPHSMHLIGLGLKKKCNIKWVADFRDPWSQWDLLDKLQTGMIARQLHKAMEKQVLKRADKIITVSKKLAEDLQKIGGRSVAVISNGVDTEDYAHILPEFQKSDKFRISYFGLLNEMRNPMVFWETMEEMASEDAEFEQELELNLAGIVSESILHDLKNFPKVHSKLVMHGYLSHEQVFKECSRSSLLLVILNNTENAKWIIPGKLFEYLSMGKPILMLGPVDSDAADLLNQLKTGYLSTFHDKETIKRVLMEAFSEYKRGGSIKVSYDMEMFSRRKLTQDLATLLDNL